MNKLKLAFSNLLVLMGLWLLINNYVLLPNTNIDGVWVGLETSNNANQKIQASKLERPPFQINFKIDGQLYTYTSDQLGVFDNSPETIRAAQYNSQIKNPIKLASVWISAIKKPNYYYSTLLIDKSKTTDILSQIATNVDMPGKKPELTLAYSGKLSSLTLNQEGSGKKLEIDQSLEQIMFVIEQLRSFAKNENITITLIVKPVYPVIDQKVLLNWISPLVGKKLELKDSNNHLNLIINDQDLINTINPYGGVDNTTLDELLDNWAEVFQKPAGSAVLEYDVSSLKVNKFDPGKPGLSLDKDRLGQIVIDFIAQNTTQDRGLETNQIDSLQTSQELPIIVASPLITLSDTNNLGIIEEIGFGESYYAHSIPSRIHNVSLAANIVQNIIIPPNDEFSFNKTLGDVSAKAGFQQAYVIKSGRTELGDGGGVCQVSTTLFRAVLDAGLKVTKRLPHSYRVSYYEIDNLPGIDATVYAGNVDLRFINDTPAHILIHSEADSQKLYMTYTIYGTSDGRVSEISDHKTWGYRPPLTPEYLQDPSLPTGYKKQIDWAASGINASFINTIKDKNGNIIRQDKYSSFYKPWSAKFLVGPAQ